MKTISSLDCFIAYERIQYQHDGGDFKNIHCIFKSRDLMLINNLILCNATYDLKTHRFLSLALVSIEKMYQTHKTLFDISIHL